MSEKPLTLEHLAAAGACTKETAFFKDAFGEGNECTYERVMSVALTFDWMFAAQNLLTDRQQDFFKAIVLNSFRGIPPRSDPTKVRRKRAMAAAFHRAYQSPE